MSRPQPPEMPRSREEGGELEPAGEEMVARGAAEDGTAASVLSLGAAAGGLDLAQDARGPLTRLAERIARHELFVRHRVILEECGDPQGRRFLEVGCGPGHYAIELARQGAAEAVGIDAAQGMLAAPRRLAEAAGVAGRVRFEAVGLHAFRPNEPFDVVVAVGLFDYMSAMDARAAVIRLRELARERVVATFPGRWRLRLAGWGVRVALGRHARVAYSRPELRRLFASVGYREPRIVYSGSVHVVSAVP